MAEIYFRLPSAVPYGYAEVKFEEEHLPDADFLGRIYANYVMAFAESERAALDAYGKPQEAPSAPPEPDVDQESTEGESVQEKAVQALSEGLGGATVVSEEAAPWKKKASAAKPKAWEKKADPSAETKAAPAVADIDW